MSCSAVVRFHRVAALLATSLWLACLSGIVSAQTTAHTDVTRIATSLPGPRYAYVAMPPAATDNASPAAQSPEFRERLQQALDKTLQAKGYVRANSAREADFLVAYRVGVQQVEQVTVKEAPAPHSGPVPQAAIECKAGGCSQLVTADSAGAPILKTSVTQSMEGNLLIEVIEPKTIRVLWRAHDSGTVKHGDGQQARLDAIARQTLNDLPALPR